MLKLALKPQWIAMLLLALGLATGFVLLSYWQFSSSTSGQTSHDPAKDVVRPYTEVFKEYRQLDSYGIDTVVEARGHYVEGSSYLVENKYSGGEKGYWVISQFLPETEEATASESSEPRAIAVARAWTPVAQIPTEPQGLVTVAGRVVVNDAPYYSYQIEEENKDDARVIGSAAPAQLANLWNTPIYSGILTADAEVAGESSLPLTDTGSLAEASTILGANDQFQPVRANQATNESVNWLNIFYAAEWVIFAGFALYLWWRMLKDDYAKQADPAQYFEYEGEYWLDEASGRYYYWDPADEQYYFFDSIEPSTGQKTASPQSLNAKE